MLHWAVSTAGSALAGCAVAGGDATARTVAATAAPARRRTALIINTFRPRDGVERPSPPHRTGEHIPQPFHPAASDPYPRRATVIRARRSGLRYGRKSAYRHTPRRPGCTDFPDIEFNLPLWCFVWPGRTTRGATAESTVNSSSSVSRSPPRPSGRFSQTPASTLCLPINTSALLGGPLRCRGADLDLCCRVLGVHRRW